MKLKCPSNRLKCREAGHIVRYGGYYRTSDRQRIQRYKCAECGVHFSQATNSPNFGQKKRYLNRKVYLGFSSKLSQRRLAILLNTTRKTIARKMIFIANEIRHKNLLDRNIMKNMFYSVQFDELEAFEHTKMKPISVTMLVEKKSRYIIGFEACKMPAKGLLAKRARKKYGYRKDERAKARNLLFRRVKERISEDVLFETDQNPHYPSVIKKHFPKSTHIKYKGRRGCVVGQGELKAGGFDPLFSLNHTYAMCRDNINRFVRRTWATTKDLQRLRDHIEIYVHYHNQFLIKNPTT